MKRMFILLTIALSCASFCFIHASSENNELNDVLFELELELDQQCEHCPPVAPVDPETGDGNCEKDREWKLWNTISDYYQYYVYPESVTPENMYSAHFKSTIPAALLSRYYRDWEMARIEYEMCKERAKK